MDLELKHPSCVGPYSVLNAARPLRPGQALNLLVQFLPENQLHYSEELIITSQYGRASVSLIGQGVSPSLQIHPEDGFLDMGHVLAGDTREASCKLKNCSEFPLTYNIIPRGALPENFNVSVIVIVRSSYMRHGMMEMLTLTSSHAHTMPSYSTLNPSNSCRVLPYFRLHQQKAASLPMKSRKSLLLSVWISSGPCRVRWNSRLMFPTQQGG